MSRDSSDKKIVQQLCHSTCKDYQGKKINAASASFSYLDYSAPNLGLCVSYPTHAEMLHLAKVTSGADSGFLWSLVLVATPSNLIRFVLPALWINSKLLSHDPFLFCHLTVFKVFFPPDWAVPCKQGKCLHFCKRNGSAPGGFVRIDNLRRSIKHNLSSGNLQSTHTKRNGKFWKLSHWTEKSWETCWTLTTACFGVHGQSNFVSASLFLSSVQLPSHGLVFQTGGETKVNLPAGITGATHWRWSIWVSHRFFHVNPVANDQNRGNIHMFTCSTVKRI